MEIGEKDKYYGLHLVMDCYQADPDKLNDTNLLQQVLEELPELVGMQKASQPVVASFDDSAVAGASGIILIVTSHISIHTYCKKDCFFMDLFSCQNFDPEKVVAYVKAKFSAKKIVWQVIERGLEFPVNNLHE